MIVPKKFKLKNTIKYPTTIIVGGINKLGLEIADSLIEQGGYVIIIDTVNRENVESLDVFPEGSMISFLDYTSILHLEEDIRRLDYVFYFAHDSHDFKNKLSTGEFLTFSNYLDAILSLSSKFEAKFLLSTSIKAHQMLYTDNDPLLSFKADPNSHTTYTDMELQRYAEGLTLEYNQKIGLDTRITRLGEIIGDGMNFGKNTTYSKLILEAIKNEPLKLSNDGLENEWYVHVLDCSYGLIKAMFSKNTDGETFSVCYENTFTHIAIAYKIQELEENAKEIQFVGDGHPLPPLKIHKPAPNLSKIGWLPRVSFEKAVVQSLAAAKIFLIEIKARSLSGVSTGKLGMVSKLKSFMSLAETNDIKSLQKGSDQDPSQMSSAKDDLRRNRINIANEGLNKRKRSRQKTSVEKFKDNIWNIFKKLASIFSIFRNKSPLEASVIIFVIALVIFLYFMFFSPLIVLAKNILILIPERDKSETYVQNMQFEKLETSSQKISTSLNEIESVMNRFEGIAGFLTLGDEYDKTVELLNTYELYAEGGSDISKALSPISQYLNAYENNTKVRTGTDSYLSLENPGIDYSVYLDKVETNAPYLEIGSQKIEKANERLKLLDVNFLPSFISNNLATQNSKLIDSELLKHADALKFLPEVLGNKTSQTYLIVAMDNTRPTPLGGDLSSFALITLQNGAITEIAVQSFDDVNFDMSLLDSESVAEINTRRFNLKDGKNLKIDDLGSLTSIEDFKEMMKILVKDTYARDINGVVAINLNVFDSLIAELATTSNIEVSNVNFDGDNFLASLNSIQPSNESLEIKSGSLAQLLAIILHGSLSGTQTNFSNIYEILGNGLGNQDIMLSFDNFDYQNFIEENDYDALKIQSADSYVSVGLNVLDNKAVNINKYPSANLALKTEITSNYDLINNLKVTFPNIGSTEEVSICLPLNVTTASIKVEGIEGNRFVVNEGEDAKCIVATILTESEILVSWDLEGHFATNLSSVVMNLAVSKLRGFDTTLDYEIEYDSKFNVSSDTNIQSVGNSIIFTKKLSLDEVIQLFLDGR